MQPGFAAEKTEELMLFGNAAEYAGQFPASRITYIHPPEFFEPAPNTERIILPQYDGREFPFETEKR